MEIYFYRGGQAPGPLNMAKDEYLMEASRRGGIHLRLYDWCCPTVTIGFSQPVSKALDLEYLEREGIPFVRRLTGGKAVLHHNEITYAVSSREPLFFSNPSPYYPYLLVSEALSLFLESLGLEVKLSNQRYGEFSRQEIACFSFPGRWEIKVKGRKLVSGAMKKKRDVFMIHGTIPINYLREKIARATKTPLSLLEKSFYSLSEVLDELPSKEELMEGILEAFSRKFRARVIEAELPEEPVRALEKKYSSKEWNYRRL